MDLILQDGGEQNREIMLMLSSDTSMDDRYLCVNIVNPSRKLAMVQDYGHKIKKLRNPVLSRDVTPNHTQHEIQH